MMVFILMKGGSKEAHIDVVRHPDSIDWIKCKDIEEAQKVVDYLETHRSIGAPISVNDAREKYLEHLEGKFKLPVAEGRVLSAVSERLLRDSYEDSLKKQIKEVRGNLNRAIAHDLEKDSQG